MRWWFTLQQAWLKRKELHAFLVEPMQQIHTLSEMTLEKLEAANIGILVLDFDGVLAWHGALTLPADTENWLRKLSYAIGEQRIAILSNQPKPERLRYFAEHFPSIHIVHGVRKKPYPDGLLEIIQYKNIAPHRVVLVDDRLLTGMLATCLAYCRGWYFYPPMRSFWRHPFKESFFSLLRGLERGFFRFCG